MSKTGIGVEVVIGIHELGYRHVFIDGVEIGGIQDIGINAEPGEMVTVDLRIIADEVRVVDMDQLEQEKKEVADRQVNFLKRIVRVRKHHEQ